MQFSNFNKISISRSKLADAFIKSGKRMGFKYIDYNSGDQIGVSYLQANTKKGWRVTAANAYLFPIIKNRPNLLVKTKSWVTKILINPITKTAEGVQFSNQKKSYEVYAKREVLLSAGPFQSPKLLMLSGIGPKAELRKFGIPIIKELPVGETMYEHPGVLGPVFIVDNLHDNLTNSDVNLKPQNMLNWFAGKGFMTTNSVEGLWYMKTPFAANPDPNVPDVEIMQAFTSFAFDSSPAAKNAFRMTDSLYDEYYRSISNQRTFQFLGLLLHPRTKGSVKLKSKNPFNHPEFDYFHFEDDRDLEALAFGMKMCAELAKQKPFQKLGIRLYEKPVPGCEHLTFASDDYWRCCVMTLTASFHHQIGTSRIGGVVDERLRVYDIKNLRVVDSGVVPKTPSAHTSAIAFMIGEKAADMIKEDRKQNP